MSAPYKVNCKLSEDGKQLGRLILSMSYLPEQFWGKHLVGEMSFSHPIPKNSDLPKLMGRVSHFVTEGVLTVLGMEFPVEWESNTTMPRGYLDDDFKEENQNIEPLLTSITCVNRII